MTDHAETPPSACAFGIGQVLLHPRGVEHMRIDAVAHLEQPASTLHTPDSFRMPHSGLVSSSANALAPPHLPVQVQQRRQIGFALEQAVAHKGQIVVALLRRVRQEQFLHSRSISAVVCGVWLPRRRGTGAASGRDARPSSTAPAPAEVRRASAALSRAVPEVQSLCQRRGLLGVKSLTSTRLPMLKGRGARVHDQVGGRGRSEQAERETRRVPALAARST